MKVLLDEMPGGRRESPPAHARGGRRPPPGRPAQPGNHGIEVGREAWQGKVFIDATGDGDLAASRRLPVRLRSRRHRRGSSPEPDRHPDRHPGGAGQAVRAGLRAAGRVGQGALRAEMERAGVSPSYAHPTLFYIHHDLFCLMANHEYGVSATDAGQITAATPSARAEVHKLVDSLRRWAPPGRT